MEWFIAAVAVVVIGIAAMAASGRLGQFGPAASDRPQPQWPEGPLAAQDIDNLGFAVVPRGYAMDQVDEFMDRVKARLEQWEGQTGADPATPDPTVPASTAPASTAAGLTVSGSVAAGSTDLAPVVPGSGPAAQVGGADDESGESAEADDRTPLSAVVAADPAVQP
ncbi:MAG: DivIVA domain-containing protein [Propionibacteriaceae bacterium]|nr:DivIVA domain-containing protein [Propionibacteriaceae bacterium]